MGAAGRREPRVRRRAPRAQAERRPEARWLRGAFWRNFQVKYREINDLHKQMLRVSAAVAAMPDGPERDRALDHLYQGQSNDCYWHGLFGGIYISHMRLATLRAPDRRRGPRRASGRRRWSPPSRRDLDMDGVDEVRLADAGQVVTVDLDGGAGIGGWDIRAGAACARGRDAPPAGGVPRDAARHSRRRRRSRRAAADGGRSAASIHDAVRVKEPGLAARLVYDAYERRSGLVRVLPLDATPEDWATARARELGDVVDGVVRARRRSAIGSTRDAA